MSAEADRALAAPDVARFDGVTMERDAAPNVEGVALIIGEEGLGLELSAGSEPRLLPWAMVKEWTLREERGASRLLVRTTRAEHHLFVPATAVVLRRVLGRFSEPSLEVAREPSAVAPETAGHDWRRFQPTLVVCLLLVLATCVALLLAQSAGAIHLPILGNSTAQSAGLTPLR
jgi:hypothetical protein